MWDVATRARALVVHASEYFEGQRYSDMDRKEIKAPRFLLGSSIDK